MGISTREKAQTFRRVAGMALLLLLAFALRVWEVGAADLTFDEVATFFVAHRSVGEMVRYVMGAAREHPPAYYVIMSLWMRWAGTSEFAVRYPSVLIGVLAVVWSFRVGRRLGPRGDWWSAVLCAVLPFSLWAGRAGRMYGLVLLLSLLVMESWLCWLERPGWRRWFGFVVLSLIAAMTHYYLVLLWPVQGLLLILLPRTTRSIRKPWLATALGIGVAVLAFIAVSPGIRTMVLEVARRFPAQLWRFQSWGFVFADFYFWGYQPELVWLVWTGLGLTLAGWIVCARRNPLTGALLAAWGVIPLLLASLVPESLETRYLTPIFPAFLFGLAVLLARLRVRLLRLLAVGGLWAFALWRVPLIYENLDTEFSTRMQTLHVAAQPGDALVMNGPWPKLLLHYYPQPDFVRVYAVPSAAPPGFSAEIDIPRLEQIVREHSRIWVSYGAIHWADPQYNVSRWLAEYTYRVYERAGIALYLTPVNGMVEVRAGVDLGPRLALRRAMVDRQAGQIGDTVRIGLALEGQSLDRYIYVTLGLLDGHGNVWQQRRVNLGPLHQPAQGTLPDQWNEQLGLVLLPGLPPGEYTLALQVEGDDVAMGEAASHYGWIPLTSFHVTAGVAQARLEGLLPNATGVTPVFDETLTVVGVEPYTAKSMQGYQAGFTLWWQAAGPTAVSQLQVRLVGPQRWEAGAFMLGPDFYPPTVWQPEEIIRQDVAFQLPDDLTAGRYRVLVQAQTGDGVALLLDGTTEDGWAELFTFVVEARTRSYILPLSITRQDVRFGEVLRLRGYRLERHTVHPGESVALTVYWQAMEKPPQMYAVFNHLRAPDNTSLWQGDSWPQAGVYTTEHWRKNEVVTEDYIIVIPEGAPPGDYPLYTGVYNPFTGSRLPATTPRGERLLNDESVLLTLSVTYE
ncbi:MAG: glycosyltransferase family 39 protein [Anaerolineae bacterium]|nr:glycosyltransferase family 39 protein [Anaerolineae bacterium]